MYAGAKDETSDLAFRTQEDVTQSGYEFISHSMLPVEPSQPGEFRIQIGGSQCRMPYSASIFNISAMSLVGIGLRDQIRIGASGKIISAFDIAAVMSIGANWANSARGFMFAIGCIQSRSCHTNTCPTGVATQDSLRNVR